MFHFFLTIRHSEETGAFLARAQGGLFDCHRSCGERFTIRRVVSGSASCSSVRSDSCVALCGLLCDALLGGVDAELLCGVAVAAFWSSPNLALGIVVDPLWGSIPDHL